VNLCSAENFFVGPYTIKILKMYKIKNANHVRAFIPTVDKV
jgi:hypothetical protein